MGICQICSSHTQLQPTVTFKCHRLSGNNDYEYDSNIIITIKLRLEGRIQFPEYKAQTLFDQLEFFPNFQH